MTHLTYQCPDKHLRVMLLDEADEGGVEGKILVIKVEEEEEVDGEWNAMCVWKECLQKAGGDLKL